MKGLSDYDLTPEQWQVMATLWWSNEILKQNDICDVTLRDKPTVSRIIDRLEEKGWLERHVDEKVCSLWVEWFIWIYVIKWGMTLEVLE